MSVIEICDKKIIKIYLNSLALNKGVSDQSVE